MGPLLTILQRGDRLCLGAEVTVPNVVGGLQTQLIGGEGPQPETQKRPVTMEPLPYWGGPQEGAFWGCIPQAAVSWPRTAGEQPPAPSAGLMISLGGQEFQGGGGGGAELPVGMELRLRAPGGGSHLL